MIRNIVVTPLIIEFATKCEDEAEEVGRFSQARLSSTLCIAAITLAMCIGKKKKEKKENHPRWFSVIGIIVCSLLVSSIKSDRYYPLLIPRCCSFPATYLLLDHTYTICISFSEFPARTSRILNIHACFLQYVAMSQEFTYVAWEKNNRISQNYVKNMIRGATWSSARFWLTQIERILDEIQGAQNVGVTLSNFTILLSQDLLSIYNVSCLTQSVRKDLHNIDSLCVCVCVRHVCVWMSLLFFIVNEVKMSETLNFPTTSEKKRKEKTKQLWAI